uniref:Anaphylatoxin-like domain-containing protein n=1 Tax=Moschus moschiferus TaxID=68415 RepID=A0A8C6DYQ0_MOSMO
MAFEKTEEETSTFKHLLIRKCCYDGAHWREETCQERAVRVTISQNCVRAFTQCCNLATKVRLEDSPIPVMLGRQGACHNPCSTCSAVRGH